MNTATVFLSYASQDADAARRISEVLRSAGLEVWFDQSELRGGDAWDASIRKQIKECALFVPIISHNTQQREEGYFRLEWKLAVDRSHLMADDKAFFFPVVLDDVPEPSARVPEKFRERQWTRLHAPSGEDLATRAFAERIARMYGAGVNPTPRLEPLTPGAGSNPEYSANAIKTLHPGLRGNDEAQRVPVVQTADPTKDATPSIAVLAFANRSSSADDEYFSDGLADELLNVLAKIKGLRVAARISAFSFKGKQTTIAEIGRMLNVAAVLEGTVRKSGNRARISVQLVKVDDGFHLWSETYDRTLDDIFAVQDDIAQCVVKELREQLLGETTSTSTIAKELSAITAKRTENPEAQRLVLQAKFFSAKRRPEDLHRAAELCEQAILIDPDYAEAYAVAAMVEAHLAFYGSVSMTSIPGEAVLLHFTEAEALAAHALKLDPTQAQALLTASDVRWFTQRDVTRRLHELEVALKLAPVDPSLLGIYAHMQQHAGAHALAEEFAAYTVALDPLSVAAHLTYAAIALFRGEFGLAEQRISHALKLDASSWWLQWHLFRILLTKRDLAGAARARIASAANRGHLLAAQALERAYEQGGWDGFVRAIVDDPSIFFLRLEVAYAHIELGNFTEALNWIEADLDNYGQGLSDIQHDRLLDPLRSHPRFAGLVKRAGF